MPNVHPKVLWLAAKTFEPVKIVDNLIGSEVRSRCCRESLSRDASTTVTIRNSATTASACRPCRSVGWSGCQGHVASFIKGLDYSNNPKSILRILGMPHFELRKLEAGTITAVHVGEKEKLGTLCRPNDAQAKPFRLHKSGQLSRRVICHHCFGVDPRSQREVADWMGFAIVP